MLDLVRERNKKLRRDIIWYNVKNGLNHIKTKNEISKQRSAK